MQFNKPIAHNGTNELFESMKWEGLGGLPYIVLPLFRTAFGGHGEKGIDTNLDFVDAI